MKKIHKLPQNLISKIAAGEVVERPASVVKELIENSIDAGADEISIYIEEGGKKSISIIDNGEGMSEEDALTSFQLHTTSKINSEEDLNEIITFGFRGEALASISAISETTIHTFNTSSRPVKLIIENSILGSNIPVPRSKGTTITVKDIFRHLPARKRFLKTDSTEYRHVHLEILKIALSKPNVRLQFFHNNKQIFDLPKTETTKKRILNLYKDLEEKDLIDFKVENNNIQIEGYIVHPSKLTHDNNKQFLFMNGRYVIDRTLNRAIKDGYGTTISKEKQPAYFLNIKLDPKTIDINIHPRKLEVKIDNIQSVYQTIRFSLDKIISKQLQQEFSARISGFSNISTNSTYEEGEPSNNTYNSEPVQQNRITDSVKTPSFNTNLKTTFSFNRPIQKRDINQAIQFSQALLHEESSFATNKFLQVFDTYLILEKEEKLLIVDQHAAHERINYERFLNKFKGEEPLEQQSLLIPLKLHLSMDKIEILEKNKQLLKNKTGIEFEIIGDDSINIKSQPVGLNSINFSTLLDEILTSIEDTNSVESEEFKHKLAAILACHNSIRAGRKMEGPEISQLLKELFACNQPYSCPHGRPIIWELTKNEIEIKFDRKK